MRKRFRHLNIAECRQLLEMFPDAVLVRADGTGYFQNIRLFATGLHTSTVTFRTCEALAKHGIIQFRDANANAGFWIKAV